MLLLSAVKDLVLDTGGCYERRWIDYFELVLSEMQYFLLAKGLKRSADVNVGKAQRLANLSLAERQLNSLAVLHWKPMANSDVELEQETCDALPGVSQTDVGEVVMRPRPIGGDLPAEQDGETRISLDDGVQLTLGKGVDTHYREAPSGVIHRGIRRGLEAKDRTRKCEIQDLAGAVVEKCREGDPAIENKEVRGTDITLAINI